MNEFIIPLKKKLRKEMAVGKRSSSEIELKEAVNEFIPLKKKLRKEMAVGKRSSSEIELMKEVVEGEWAWLPSNIQDLILDKLVSLTDYVRYGAVCKSWLKVALENCNLRGHPQNVLSVHRHNHQLPLLMIPHRFDEDRAGFYSVTHEKKLEFELSVPYHQRFIGSSLGWLISIDTNYAIKMFNPFSKKVHHLPAVKVNWGDSAFDLGTLEDETLFNHEYYIVKAVLSADPDLHPKDYILMIFYSEFRRLAFIRPGGKPVGIGSWAYLSLVVCGIRDIIFIDDVCYAIHRGGQVFNFKLQANEDMVESYSLISPRLKSRRRSCFSRYIIEGAGGEVLQVLRYGVPPSKGGFPSYLTLDFEVFKLDGGCGNWVELKSLGDQVLFVGDNSSLSVLASHYRGCEPGAIYYSFGVHSKILKRKLNGDIPNTCDTGVFNLENRKIRPHKISYNSALCYAMHQFPPIWVVPTFQAPSFLK